MRPAHSHFPGHSGNLVLLTRASVLTVCVCWGGGWGRGVCGRGAGAAVTSSHLGFEKGSADTGEGVVSAGLSQQPGRG